MYSHILSSELNVFNCVQELCTFGLYMCGYQMKTIQKVYSGVQHIMCCGFAMIFFVLCTLCCQFLWIVPIFDCTLRYSLTFIQTGKNVKIIY
jgi:hypothetical protein